MKNNVMKQKKFLIHSITKLSEEFTIYYLQITFRKSQMILCYEFWIELFRLVFFYD